MTRLPISWASRTRLFRDWRSSQGVADACSEASAPPTEAIPHPVVYRIGQDPAILRIIAVAHRRRGPDSWLPHVEEPPSGYLPAA